MSEYKIYKPMKYIVEKEPARIAKKINSSDYGLELKVDGCSYILAKDPDGSVHLYSDRISKKTQQIVDKIDRVPHMRDFAEEFFPNGSQILIEVTYRYEWHNDEYTYKGRTTSKYVNTIMLSTANKAVKKQELTEPCGAYMFDILYWDSKPYYDEDCIDRYNKLRELYEEWEDVIGLEWLSCTYMVMHNKKETLDRWFEEGEEGGILKLLRSTSNATAKHLVSNFGETAKRPLNTTLKIKKSETIDAIIVDVVYPSKEYTGSRANAVVHTDEDGNPVNRLWALKMISSFIIGAYNDDGDIEIIGSVSSGLTDKNRKDCYKHPEDFIGSVIECGCMEVDKKERTLRHPRVNCFRPDKSPEECFIKDVFGE